MKRITAALLFLLTIPSLAAQKQKQPDFEFIDIPDTTYIRATGINDNGDITGTMYHKDGAFGFIKHGDQITRLSVPGALFGIWPAAIDNQGRVTGYFYDEPLGYAEGFLYENGQVTTFQRGDNIYPMGISEGKVVGLFQNHRGQETHGFLYANGQFTDLDYPGASSTGATGINRDGKIVGWFQGTDSQGFTYLNGQWQEIRFPRLESRTQLQAISNSDIIIGGVSGSCGFDMFMLVKNKFSLLGLPQDVYITGVNSDGIVIGNTESTKPFIARASAFILRH